MSLHREKITDDPLAMLLGSSSTTNSSKPSLFGESSSRPKNLFDDEPVSKPISKSVSQTVTNTTSKPSSLFSEIDPLDAQLTNSKTSSNITKDSLFNDDLDEIRTIDASKVNFDAKKKKKKNLFEEETPSLEEVKQKPDENLFEYSSDIKKKSSSDIFSYSNKSNNESNIDFHSTFSQKEEPKTTSIKSSLFYEDKEDDIIEDLKVSKILQRETESDVKQYTKQKKNPLLDDETNNILNKFETETNELDDLLNKFRLEPTSSILESTDDTNLDPISFDYTSAALDSINTEDFDVMAYIKENSASGGLFD